MFKGANSFNRDLCAIGWNQVRSATGVDVTDFCDVGTVDCGSWDKDTCIL